MQSITISPISTLSGEIFVPGDKSISHRALLLGALASGTVKVFGFLQGEDPLATMQCLRELGVEISMHKGGGGEEKGERSASAYGDVVLVVNGSGGHFTKPRQPLFVGNSGTTIRILSGILAAQAFDSEIFGDASIARRPMRRVVDPLALMGAKVVGQTKNGQVYPPLKIFGKKLQGITYRLPMASAQVKSALLLAGLLAEGKTTIEEPMPSRDHTERMLLAMGVKIERVGHAVSIVGGQKILGNFDVFVPGDISSAAFFMVAATMVPGAHLLIRNVGLNPSRTGILEVLHRMGAPYAIVNEEIISEEPRGDIEIKSSATRLPAALQAIEIGGELIPRLIDEIPIVAVLATQATGQTVIKDAKELRVKESDRLEVLFSELTKMGARISMLEDGLIIDGPAKLKAARVNSHGDHRIAMALAVAALIADGETTIEDIACVETSFPGFFEVLKRVA